MSGIEISELAFKPIEHLPQQVHIGALGHPDGRARHDVPPVDEIGEQHLHHGGRLAEVSGDLGHRQQPLTAADDPPVLGLEGGGSALPEAITSVSSGRADREEPARPRVITYGRTAAVVRSSPGSVMVC